jgi:hypothetical protein
LLPPPPDDDQWWLSSIELWIRDYVDFSFQQEFNTKQKLRNHFYRWHRQGKRAQVFPCSQCDKSYRSRAQLQVQYVLCVCECVCVCAFMCVHVCLCVCMRVCVRVCACACMRVCVWEWLLSVFSQIFNCFMHSRGWSHEN